MSESYVPATSDGGATQEDTGADSISAGLWGAATDFISSFVPTPVRMALEKAPAVVDAVKQVAEGGGLHFLTTGYDQLAEENQQQILEATDHIPNQDIIYEQLAHNLAYGKANTSQLKSWGYGNPKVLIPLNAKTGMYVVAVCPDPTMSPETRKQMEKMQEGPLRPVIAFRGSTDAVDWADDFSPEGIGAFHFSQHKSEITARIAEIAAETGVAPDLTGHSLGGALAEMATTCGVPVGRVVTFQAPGLSPELLAQVPEDIQATHHRAANDFVGWAGGQQIAGDAYIYNETGLYPADGHKEFLLTDLSEARANDPNSTHEAIPGIYDGSVFNDAEGNPTFNYDMKVDPETGELVGCQFDPTKFDPERHDMTWVSKDAPDMDFDGQTDWFEEAYRDGRASLSETVRQGVGDLLRTGDDTLASLDGAAAADHEGMAAPLMDAMGWLWQQGRENLYGGDVTGVFGNGLNNLTNGKTMGVSGDDMELSIETWKTIEPQIGVVPEDVIFAEIDAAGFQDPALAEQMKKQVEMAAPAAPTEHWGPPPAPAPAEPWGPA